MVSIIRNQDHARIAKKLKKVQRKKDKIEKKEFIRIVNVRIKEAIDSNRNYCEVCTIYFDIEDGMNLIRKAGYTAWINNVHSPGVFEIWWKSTPEEITMSQVCNRLGNVKIIKG